MVSKNARVILVFIAILFALPNWLQAFPKGFGGDFRDSHCKRFSLLVAWDLPHRARSSFVNLKEFVIRRAQTNPDKQKGVCDPP
jgi:hypothetical protein